MKNNHLCCKNQGVIKIGTFFGLVVFSGQEKKIQKKLQQSIIGKELLGVYALDKYYCFETDSEKDIMNVLDMNEYELTNYLRLLQMKEHVDTLQHALEGVTLKEWQQIKVHDEIIRIEKEVSSISPKKQMLMLRGYVLIETRDDFSELPTYLYNHLKEIEGVTKVSSKLPIPAHEMGHFFKKNIDLQNQIEKFYEVQQEMQVTLSHLLEQTEIYI